MKNYKLWLAIVIVLLIINSVLLVVMWLPKKNLRDKHPDMEPKDYLTNILALTPKQKELYTTMRNKHRQLVNKLDKENQVLKDSLLNMIKKPAADTALISSLSKQIGNNRSSLEKVTVYHFREFRTILTASQQTKFDDIIIEVMRMMAKPNRGGPGRAPHDGPGREGMLEHNGPPPGDIPPGPDPLPDGPPPN